MAHNLHLYGPRGNIVAAAILRHIFDILETTR